jgi:hypothetical protein
MELGRKQCRIRTPDAEHDKYPRIAQHGRTDVRHDLVGKLMTEAAPRHSLPNLRIQSKGLVWLQLAAVSFMTIVGTVSSSRDFFVLVSPRLLSFPFARRPPRPPFDADRLGVVSELTNADVKSRKPREEEPTHEEAIERLKQHA